MEKAERNSQRLTSEKKKCKSSFWFLLKLFWVEDTKSWSWFDGRRFYWSWRCEEKENENNYEILKNRLKLWTENRCKNKIWKTWQKLRMFANSEKMSLKSSNIFALVKIETFHSPLTFPSHFFPSSLLSYLSHTHLDHQPFPKDERRNCCCEIGFLMRLVRSCELT